MGEKGEEVCLGKKINSSFPMNGTYLFSSLTR